MSVKNEKFVADKLVVRAVDIVASLEIKRLLFKLTALRELNVAVGKIRVDALSVQVVIFVTLVVEMVTLDADKVVTLRVDISERSKRELET